VNALNIQYQSTFPATSAEEHIAVYYIDIEQEKWDSLFPIEIAGYDFITTVTENYETSSSDLIVIDGTLTERFNLSAERFNLSEVKTTLLSRISQTSPFAELSKEELTFDLRGDIFDIKLIINHCSLHNPQYAGDTP
jgi:hypothetical protein